MADRSAKLTKSLSLAIKNVQSPVIIRKMEIILIFWKWPIRLLIMAKRAKSLERITGILGRRRALVACKQRL